MSVSSYNLNSTQELLDIKENLDTFFLIINGFIILLMQPGFALLECGAVRSKNATNILVKNMVDAFFSGVVFWLVGYAFAYGKGNSFLGTEQFALFGLESKLFAKWFFQYVFAATAATIVSGSMAERCEAVAYITYSAIISGFLYPIIAHWVWADDGWLKVGSGINEPNYHDFAGSGALHITGGTCALIGAIFLGPRTGRFDSEIGIRGHSVPLSIVGGMILLVGFLSFIGGCQGSISQPGDGFVVAKAVCNATISGCFGGIVTTILVRVGILGKPKSLSVIHAMNGALTGMVAMCAGADVLQMWSSALTGSIASLFYLATHVLILKAKIDDPLDAVAVHLGGGFWGVLATPLFRHDVGVLMTWSKTSGYYLLWSLAGIAAIFVWSSVLSIIMFGALKKLNLLRVSVEVEIKGLDLTVHYEPAYPVESWFEEQYQDLMSRGKRKSITPYDISRLPPFSQDAKKSLDAIHDEEIKSGYVNPEVITDEDKNH